jgi:hypothetical protein
MNSKIHNAKYHFRKDFILTYFMKQHIFGAAVRKNTTHFIRRRWTGEDSMSNPKLLIFAGIVCLGVCGLALADGTLDPNLYPNLNGDEIINFADFALMANNWLLTDEGLAGDFDDSNSVDYNDLSSIANYWLEGPPPLTVFEKFKAALAASDVNKALTFVSEISRDKYAQIFQVIEPKLPDYAAGMGDLILDSQQEGEVKYEMRHQVGSATYLFPVIFMKDEDGNWKIDNF